MLAAACERNAQQGGMGEHVRDVQAAAHVGGGEHGLRVDLGAAAEPAAVLVE